MTTGYPFGIPALYRTSSYPSNKNIAEVFFKAVLYTTIYGEITNSNYQELANVSKATATIDIKELEGKALLNNIGTKGSSAIYKLGVGS